jgi:hypothetical protein
MSTTHQSISCFSLAAIDKLYGAINVANFSGGTAPASNDNTDRNHAINSAIQVSNSALAQMIDTNALVLRSALDAEQNLLSMYANLKEYKTAQRALAAAMVTKEVYVDSEQTKSTTFQAIWAALAFVDDSLIDQNLRQARLEGFKTLQGNWEAQKKYADMMVTQLTAETKLIVAGGFWQSATQIVILGVSYNFVDCALSDGIAGTPVIVIFDSTPNPATNIYTTYYVGKTDAMTVAGYTANVKQQEIDMWYAAGAELDYAAPVAEDTHRTSDVSRNFAEETLAQRMQKYVALGQDYLGKMELCAMYASTTNENEEKIWVSLGDDAGVQFRIRQEQANAAKKERT